MSSVARGLFSSCSGSSEDVWDGIGEVLVQFCRFKSPCRRGPVGPLRPMGSYKEPEESLESKLGRSEASTAMQVCLWRFRVCLCHIPGLWDSGNHRLLLPQLLSLWLRHIRPQQPYSRASDLGHPQNPRGPFCFVCPEAQWENNRGVVVIAYQVRTLRRPYETSYVRSTFQVYFGWASGPCCS